MARREIKPRALKKEKRYDHMIAFREDSEIVEKAKELDIDFAEFFRAALRRVVKDKRCPYCRKEM